MINILNLQKAIYFYDDRSKDKTVYKAVKVLYFDDEVCLCLVGLPYQTASENLFVHLLFKREDGTVLNSEFDSFYATQDKEFEAEYFASLQENVA